MAPALKIRAYSNFLTPLLHRRFSRASAILVLLCYVEALILGQWNSLFWSWFPFSWVGIRTGLLFICAFVIFILRVSQLHVGQRTTTSGYSTFRKYALQSATLQTTVWYVFSAWLFSEIYIWSAPRDAHINWITDAKNNERPRLNERPIYLTCYFLMLAIVQAAVHLYYDYDRIPMPTLKRKPVATLEERAHLTIDPFVQLKANLPMLVTQSLKRALVVTIVGPVIYKLTIRDTAWSWTLMFAKIFWNLPKSTAIPVISPFHWRLLFRTFSGGSLLNLTWELGNAAFSAYVAQEPLKNGRPITYESRDPNGSLITGLKGKKLQTKAFAFWELASIATEYQGRRKTIFEDIDRLGGSSWSQISTICLSQINEVNDRISAYLNPPAAATLPTNTIPDAGLPRLTAGPRRENVLGASQPPKGYRETISQTTASLAQTYGQTPSSPVAQAKHLLDKAKSAVLSPAQEEALSPSGIFAALQPFALEILQYPIGVPFRQSYCRRLNAIMLGTPHGDVGIIVDAIDALTRLVIHSLKEDPYGNVQHSIPLIIRTLTVAIQNGEKLKEVLPIHWTDIEKKRESPEVEIILSSLRADLKELLDTFGSYSADLKLGITDIRAAKAAITVAADEHVQSPKETVKGPRPEIRQPEMRQREDRPSVRQRRSDR